jgi:hypothetical protein
MPRLKKLGRTFAVLMAAGSCFLMLASPGCKSSTSPESTVASIVITNNCGASVSVWLDGAEKLIVENLAQDTIGSVAPGSRLLEVKKADDLLLILSQTLDVKASTTTYVTITGGASVRVTNQYGEILSIYDNDMYVGDIGDQITQTIRKVTFGTHVYQAKKKSDGTVAAEITIDVTDLTEYTWTITP